MTGLVLLLPFFLARFGLMARLDRDAVRRAAHFAPLSAGEKPAYCVYQLSNGAILVYLFFLRIRPAPAWLFALGAAVWLAGLVLLIRSVADFAAPSATGIHTNGVYRLSRNPMDVAYFLFFTGCALLTQSPLLFAFVALFQISAHWIVRAEERWCVQQFGEEYQRYMERVRRYI